MNENNFSPSDEVPESPERGELSPALQAATEVIPSRFRAGLVKLMLSAVIAPSTELAQMNSQADLGKLTEMAAHLPDIAGIAMGIAFFVSFKIVNISTGKSLLAGGAAGVIVWNTVSFVLNSAPYIAKYNQILSMLHRFL